MRNTIGPSASPEFRLVRHASRAAAVVGIIFFAGCARTFPPVPSRFDVAEREFAVAPKALLQSAKDAVAAPPLSLGVEREEKGTFFTSYQRFPGEWHIGRRWQERTKYRVAVIPDFDEPASRARLQVTEQTEQRAAEGQDWKPAHELNRPERAKALLDAIVTRVEETAATQPSAR